MRLLMMLASTLLLAVGIFLYAPAESMPLAGEGAMLSIFTVTGIEFARIKVCFDISMVTISLITCLICLHSFGSVGAGAVCAAFLVGTEWKWMTRTFGPIRDRVLGTGCGE